VSQTSWCVQSGDDVLLRIKAVPGASRDQIAGPLGDRLKVRVSAPPEGGKANDAICDLLAAALGVNRRDVAISSGASSPEKSVRVIAIREDFVVERLRR
jgi:uncharacterized protein